MRKLYYQSKIAMDLCSKRTVFHAISTKDDDNKSDMNKYLKDYTLITIEIEKDKILISSNNIKSLSSVINV